MEPTGVRTGVRVGVRAAMGVLDTVLTAPAAPALPVVTLAEIAERVPPGEVDIPRRDRKTGEATGEVLIPTSSPCPTCVLDAIADTGTCTRFVVGNLGMTGGVFERTIIDAGSVPFFFSNKHCVLSIIPTSFSLSKRFSLQNLSLTLSPLSWPPTCRGTCCVRSMCFIRPV